jgi:hypothetical protein
MKLIHNINDKSLSNFFQKRYIKESKRKGKKYGSTPKYADETNGNHKYIHAPKELVSFPTDRKKFDLTIKFINNIEKYVGKRDCILDFSETVYFSACSMLLVFSTTQLALRKGSGNYFKTELKKSSVVFINSTIKRMQLDKICKQNGEASLDFSAKKRLPIVYGSDIEYADEIVDFIQKRFYNDNMDPNIEHKISDAITETLNNVSVHAYPKRDISEKNWWLICDVIGDQLYLAIYDRGVGIPETVLEKKWILASCKKTNPKVYNTVKSLYPEDDNNFLIRLIQRFSDEELIHISMIGDVSGTRNDGRGQGSKSISAFVEDTNNGELNIFSNKGLYGFQNHDTGPELTGLPEKIPGTLVQWNIKINEN